MMDNVSRWNARAVLRNIHEAQVMSLFFPHVGRALIIDLRHDEHEGPLITTDGILAGPQERLDSLKRLRPRLDPPENITLAPWLGPVRSLDSTGVLAEIESRLDRIGQPQAKRALNAAYQELLSLERSEVLALILGDVARTRTLYQR